MSNPSAYIQQLHRELDAVKLFWKTDDSRTEVELIEVVKTINYLVNDLACSVTELLVERLSLETPNRMPSCILPARIFELLSQPTVGKDTRQTLLELVIRNHLLEVCHDGIRRWGVEMGNQGLGNMRALYESICETEDTSVAAAWRAITYRHSLRMLSSTRADEELDELRVIRDALHNSLQASGLTRLEDFATVNAFADPSLQELSRAVVKLREDIAQNVLSGHLEPVFVSSGTPLEPGMSVILKGHRSSPERVLCTLGLGLSRARRSGGVLEVVSLLAPDVASESVIEALLPVA